MKFIKKLDEYHSVYEESENGHFAIGIEKMLFGRLRVCVLHKTSGDKPEHMIDCYTSYDPILIFDMFEKILLNLEQADNNIKGWHWFKIFLLLPANNKKYLEDKMIDPDFVERRNSLLEQCERMNKEYNNI